MCVVCLMIDNSIPSPKSLVTSLNETNTQEDHIDTILDRISEKMTEDAYNRYVSDFHSELYLDFLRNA